MISKTLEYTWSFFITTLCKLYLLINKEFFYYFPLARSTCITQRAHNNYSYQDIIKTTPKYLPHQTIKITTLSLILIIALSHTPVLHQEKLSHKNNTHQHNPTHTISSYIRTLIPHHKITTSHNETTIPKLLHSPQQSQFQYPNYIDIQYTTMSITFYIIKQPHYKNPTLQKVTTYIIDLHTLILLGGDIHPNPGPPTHVTNTSPRNYTQRQKSYTISHTTTPKPSYAHLERLLPKHLTQHTPNQILTNTHRNKTQMNKLSWTLTVTMYKENTNIYHPQRNPPSPYSNPKHNNLHSPRDIAKTNTITNLPPPHIHQPKTDTKTYKQPQLTIYTVHHTQPQLLLLQCGDIHPNPGPMPNLLQTHPTAHKRRQTTYFLPSTIKFQPEYQHLAKTFKPLFQHTHPSHTQTINSLPHLYNYIQQHSNHPPSWIIFAMIVTISPSPIICSTHLQQPPTQDWTSQLLEKMTGLTNPPERHINTPHPYTQFRNIYKDIITPSNTIHNKLYDYIHQNHNSLNIQDLQKTFPYLPRQLLTEALRYNEPINEYTHPNPTPIQNLAPSHNPTPLTSQHTYAITWNASSLNTAMPCLQDLITNPQQPPSIITIQETKLSATKSTNYIQKLFPQYKLFFNNTHNITRVTRQRMTYRGHRGGLLLLIHTKHAFPGNLSKIPTPANISPFLQITRIANQPLQPWLLINLYMPSHEEDLPLIPIIQNTITNQINTHPNHTYILYGDFNRDIALIGRQNDQQITTPQMEDYNWRAFTTSLELSYVLTNTTFSRQGGHNYTQNNLIDGFFIKTPHNHQYTSTTNQHIQLNSDHLPIQLQIPSNTLIAKSPTTNSEPQPRILNPIPKEKLENFYIKFLENNSNQIDELIHILKYNHLTKEQWQQACNSLNTLTDNITNTLLETCSAPPIPILPNNIANQGGYLPKKSQKSWKKHLSTYHLIRKTIYITKNNPNWRVHPIITQEITNHTHATIPPPPDPPTRMKLG